MVRQLLNLADFSRVDHRMHNKVMVVDNRAAIIGGRNLADEYFGSHDDANFRELEVLTAGPAVLSLSRQFDDYWNSDWSFPVDRIITAEPKLSPEAFESWVLSTAAHRLNEDPVTRAQAWMTTARKAVAGEVLVIGDIPAANNPDAPEESPVQLSKVLIDWMEGSNEELILVSAYLIPTPELEQAIESAEDRGVRVRVLTNSLRSNNRVAAHSAYRHHVPSCRSWCRGA
jgi:putative cardiolipin synthase